MKNLVFVSVLFFLFGCKNYNKHSQILTDNEWHDIIAQSFALSNIKKPHIFTEYDNVGLKRTIINSYINSTFLGYKVNDSILNYINTRENKSITNHLDTMFTLSFISDTICDTCDYVVFSEPVIINNGIILVSLLNRIKRKDNTFKKVFYFKKRKDKVVSILGYYDVNKDTFYKATPISTNP